MATVSIKKALEYVSKHPEPRTDVTLDLPVWELVARSLYTIANLPDSTIPGSMRRATKAQKLILNRLVGTRRAGTHPVARKTEEVTFVDLTAGVIE